MTFYRSANFNVTARDDGLVACEVTHESGGQLVTWTMTPDAAAAFAENLRVKAERAREIGPDSRLDRP